MLFHIYDNPALHPSVKPFIWVLSYCYFVNPVEGCTEYYLQLKEEYHRRAGVLLKQIAADLGYSPNQYEVRSNKAGPALWGEVTLHADDLYVQFCLNRIAEGLEILHRWCQGQQDYTGGPNHWLRFSALENYETVLQCFERTRDSGHAQD
jgi:hypothetical protein